VLTPDMRRWTCAAESKQFEMGTMATMLKNEAGALEAIAFRRLQRFNAIADIADATGSPIWGRLAARAARQAFGDYLLVGMLANRAEDADHVLLDTEAA